LDPVLPWEGLQLRDILAVLGNLWWVLSLPVQCAVGPDNIADLQGIVASTPLLHAFYMFITILSQSSVGPSGVDLAKFWADCSGPERCYLTYRALSDVDKLLDAFFCFVRPWFPALREAVNDGRSPMMWTLVNPTLFTIPPINWLHPKELDSVQ
jgi:hypothetical protein